tara:strand:+ start:24 stop:227 length:204 start_codon:yes stop_codon:yes gene_type:complete
MRVSSNYRSPCPSVKSPDNPVDTEAILVVIVHGDDQDSVLEKTRLCQDAWESPIAGTVGSEKQPDIQ